MRPRFPQVIEGSATDTFGTAIRDQIIGATGNVLHYCVMSPSASQKIDRNFTDNMLDVMSDTTYQNYDVWYKEASVYYNKFVGKISPGRAAGFERGNVQNALIYDIYTDKSRITSIDVRRGQALMTHMMDNEEAELKAFGCPEHKTLRKWHDTILNFGKDSGLFYEQQTLLNFSTVTWITTDIVRKKLFQHSCENQKSFIYRATANRTHIFGNTLDIETDVQKYGPVIQNALVPATSSNNNSIDRINLFLMENGDTLKPEIVTALAGYNNKLVCA